MRCVHAVMLPAIVRANDPASRRRIANHLDLVPGDNASIKFVLQNAVAPLRIAVDRRCAPRCTSPRRRNALAIKITSNLPRCLSVDVAVENAADDGGLLFIDLQFARTPD